MSTPDPLFADVIKEMGPVHGNKPLPVEGADLVPVEYLYRRGAPYEAGRRDFNNYNRKLMVKSLVRSAETRGRVQDALLSFRETGIREFSDPIDDPLFKTLATRHSPRQALLEAGLTEADLKNFAKEHHYVDKAWLRDFVKKPETQLALTAIRKDSAYLAQIGVTADDLPKSLVEMNKIISQGYGAQLLKALIGYQKEPLFKHTLANGAEKMFSISDILRKSIFDRHAAMIRDHHGHLGLINKEDSEILSSFLLQVSNRQGADKLLRSAEANNPQLARIYARLKEAGEIKNHQLVENGPNASKLSTKRTGELKELLGKMANAYEMPPEYLRKMPVNHNDQSSRITLKFLRGLQEDHPSVFEAFVQLKAAQQTDTEQRALQEGNVSVGYKYSQWFMRLLQAKNPAVYEKVVPILAREAAQRDLDLMRGNTSGQGAIRGGKLPLGFNVHHINPLSNGYAEQQMLKIHPQIREEIIARVEAGKPIHTVMNRPSIELINRLDKLGLMGNTHRGEDYRYAATFVGNPLTAGQLKEWSDRVYERLTQPIVKESDRNIARDPRVGFLDLQLDPTKKGVTAFSTADRQFFTKRGVPQWAYVRLADASIQDGKFDQAAYRREADKICRTLVYHMLSEEKAYQVLSEQHIVGGNSTGMYLGKDGEVHFNAARGNLLLVNSSASHPIWNDHSALHIGIDPQSKQRTNAEEIARLEGARNHAPAEDQEKISAAIAHVQKEAGGTSLSEPQPQRAYIPMPRDIVLTDKVARSAWGGASNFRKVFTHPEKFSRETWWMPWERSMRETLPADTTFGNLTPSSYVDKQSLDYQQGFAIGSIYGQIRKGKQPWDQEPPLLPARYSVDLHAGFRDGEEKAEDLPPLVGLSPEQVRSALYYLSMSHGFRGYDEREPAPYTPPAPFTLRPTQKKVVLDHQAMQSAKRSTPAPGQEQGGVEPTISQ
ncbi:MAG: hypothetical protein PW734_01140 [Verrucomicrobium sp.]|nr:hypothetical protein [Verrucomicrobium sp.]